MSRADQFAALPDDTHARWMRFARPDQRIFPVLLGLEMIDVRVDYAAMRIGFREELLQAAGVVHGGVYSSMLDAVVVPAVGSTLERGANFATVDMHVQFMRGNRDEDMIAEGWVVRRGRTTAFCESEVIAADSGKVLARSVLTYSISEPRPKA